MKKIREITVKELIQYWIDKQEKETGNKELCVIDLSSRHIKKCKDYYTKSIQDLMNIFFRTNFINNSHDTEMFHFPEDRFEELYEKIIPLVPQKTIKLNNQKYSTASSYIKMKARKYFVKTILQNLKLLDADSDVEISFEDYKFSEDYYYYSDYYDSQEWVEYDKFRNPEEKNGLYDLNTKECDNLNPKGMITENEILMLRAWIRVFIQKRILMQVPGAEGACSLYKDLINKEFYTIQEVTSVSVLNSKFAKFAEKYLIESDKERKGLDLEMYEWFKNNNDYTLYVKGYKNSSKNSKYLRRTTCQAYIEAYHNAIGALYGYEIFDEDKNIEKEEFIETRKGLNEPIRAIWSRLLEDKMVTYKENLDWNKDEVDEFFISYNQEAEIQNVQNCISEIEELDKLETL